MHYFTLGLIWDVLNLKNKEKDLRARGAFRPLLLCFACWILIMYCWPQVSVSLIRLSMSCFLDIGSFGVRQTIKNRSWANRCSLDNHQRVCMEGVEPKTSWTLYENEVLFPTTTDRQKKTNLSPLTIFCPSWQIDHADMAILSPSNPGRPHELNWWLFAHRFSCSFTTRGGVQHVNLWHHSSSKLIQI